jgi:pimeloyl-ACP methyl ester carboxylesterase
MKKEGNKFKVFKNGTPGKISIIFIHGFPFDHNIWNDQVKELSNDYYCVTYDIRGLGGSGDEVQFTLEDLVDDLFDLIKVENLHNPVLCGLSMGGYIALRAVEKQESEFRGLILCDTKSEADSNEAKLKRAAGIKQITEEGVDKFISVFIPQCFKEESIKKLGGRYLDIYKRSSEFDPEGIKGCLLAMAARTDTTDYLTKLKLPVLLLCGEEDKLTPPNIMRSMSDKIKNSEFIIVPESGHMSPVENPVFVNERIKKFLKNFY